MTLSFLSSSISIDMEYEETEKMAHLSYTKDFPGIADVFLRDPGLYAPLLQFIEGVMTRVRTDQGRAGDARRSRLASQQLRFLRRRPSVDASGHGDRLGGGGSARGRAGQRGVLAAIFARCCGSRPA
jgi:hypothetical protein